MKKIYLSILFALPFFISCQKSADTPDAITPEKLHNVSFNVSGFSQSMVDLGFKSSAKTASVEPQVNFIVYCIYNKDVLVKKVEQAKNTDTGFGVIKEQLPAGSYSLAVAAGTRRLSVSSPELFSSALIYNYGVGNLGDTFVKTVAFTIGEKDHQENITVDRIAAKLELSLQDKIPSDVTKITLMYNTSSYYRFQSKSGYVAIGTETIIVQESDRSQAGAVFTGFVVPEKGTGNLITDVTISCYNAKNDVIVNKVIKDVVFETNKTTILSGKLFEKASSLQSNFQITIPTKWEDGTIVNF